MSVSIDALPRSMNDNGGQPCTSNADAACCLAQGHPKCKPVATAWNQRDRTDDHDGDDDARSPSFGNKAGKPFGADNGN